MAEQIDALLFDMGGTLRRATPRTPSETIEIVRQILQLIGSHEDPGAFTRLLSAHAKAYRKWAKQNLLELNEVDLWSRWMLPDLSAEKISSLALQLNQIWRDATGQRKVIPEAQEIILSLYRRGYRLGLVSNTTSSVEVPRLLDELGLSGCFDTVVLSCQVGKRKPGPAILLEAAERMGILPESCAYIGDRPERDVAAARNAGFGRTVILRNLRKPISPPDDPRLLPDHFIDNLKELLQIFPTHPGPKIAAPDGRVYAVSLSSMWGVKKFAAFGDFLLAAPRLGLATIELNHQVRPAMLAGLDLKSCRINSIHEPCPAVIAAGVLRKQDLLISSPDEDRRREGVNSIKHSIDLAGELGVRALVVHCGQIQGDPTLEPEMVSLFESGQAGTQKYGELKNRFVELRAALIPPYLAAVKKSLLELLDYAGRFNVRLGIENRFHYFDIPTLDEMCEILELADPDRIGFLYDIGHAQVLDRLGFFPHAGWLDRFARRIVGVHLHDVSGIRDHLAPGLGEIDFHWVAGYLPKTAFRTLEVKSDNTPEQIKTGLKILLDAGCINLLQ
jgi:HAD superfamily hydrolase (TIGR01549 family)